MYAVESVNPTMLHDAASLALVLVLALVIVVIAMPRGPSV
jgi:hypothetical protein